MFEKPKLTISYDALEPHIDARTMQIHYEKHHQGYVNKLNKAIEGTEFENVKIEKLLTDNIPEKIKNNAGGHFNHTLFWEILKPNIKEEGDVIEKIKEQWNSIEEFKKEFKEKAMEIFGSGWCWLVKTEKLKIITTSNQDAPKEKIILGLDVWEHAYYLKYQNKRADYIDAFWNVVDWEKLDERHKV